MKKRIIFDRIEDMKYISHLDTSRFFERLFRKTGIKIRHSEGFTPRPKISFGNPVSLGDESYNELMDAEITSDLSNEELIDILNKNSPKGFIFKKMYDVPKKSGISNDFDIVTYEVRGKKEDLSSLHRLLEQNEIVEIREKRGKTQERNLKNKIFNYKVIEDKIILELYNVSPKPLLILAGLNPRKLNVARTGYKQSNKLN